MTYELRISDWSSDVCSSDLQTTDPTGHHSRRSTGHRSCRRAGTATPGMGYNLDISPVQCICSCICKGGRYGPEKSSFRPRSEEHTSELQSLMRISYAVFCLKKKKKTTTTITINRTTT